MKHVCGARGFGLKPDDVCPACQQDPYVGPPPGYLQVGMDEDMCHVVVNHPQLLVDAKGCGFLVFTPTQARMLAALLIKHAGLCELAMTNFPEGAKQ